MCLVKHSCVDRTKVTNSPMTLWQIRGGDRMEVSVSSKGSVQQASSTHPEPHCFVTPFPISSAIEGTHFPKLNICDRLTKSLYSSFILHSHTSFSPMLTRGAWVLNPKLSCDSLLTPYHSVGYSPQRWGFWVWDSGLVAFLHSQLP